MIKFKLVNVLGIVGALSLPAVVVAQQFNRGDVLTAEILQQLERRIATLENSRGLNAAKSTAAFAENEIGTKTFRATGDGIMIARSIGPGFQSARLNVDMPFGNVGHARGGSSVAIPLRQNDVVSIESATAFGGTVALFWYPLNGDSSLQ